MTDTGNAEQVRAIAEQVAEAAISKFVSDHPELRRGAVVTEIPAPLKWAGGIAAAIMTAGAIAFTIWLATTLSETKDTTIRIEERQNFMAATMADDMRDVKSRIEKLEAYHREGGR